ANNRPRMLIWDGFSTHETLEILEFCFENNIILCRMPSHTSHKLQPCDVAVFGPLKAAYRDEVERMERGGVGTIGKQHFTYLYSPARERALTKRNIIAAWRGSGLFPFNPNRVLADMPRPTKPPAELTILTLPTPTTPVSSEGLGSLLDMIKHMPNDESSSQRKERLQQKVSNAALTFLAKNALLRDQNKFLVRINNEGKTRRATKSKMLGTAKVMTWHERSMRRKSTPLQAEEATAGKTQRGRKRKSATEGADASEPKAKIARISNTQISEDDQGASALPNATCARISNVQAWKAPVARMW
ncbi:DDE-domain-containing protein, partial [Melanomma pulvis-pyrius CBS 109.77]